MAGRMSRSLMILVLAAGLGACATERAAPPAAANAPAAAPVLTADPAATPYGLFLAGQVARDAGHLSAANFYLGRAAAAEGEPSFLKADAFTAALQAGDVTAAAAIIPDPADPGGRVLRAFDIQTGKAVWELPQTGAADSMGGVLSTAGGVVSALARSSRT